ncbi:condensin-2 complex subunit H2 isoform X2 [Perca flavescens]|nr:condensin-2 complex subunit H2 isoform X2 [Perca flavescens]XP_028427034.1 condensin-2 complex subunit H2 isoform X2 [Perca flavescens]
MESTESRFPHLLQPIRELTKNWEIDVASELNDYLDELDDMCITFDGGKTRLNFAEAALLIQGSACIYSKKVELLHSLVYQTLDYINDRNKKGNKQTAAAKGAADSAVSDHDGDDDEAEFSPLDIDASENSPKADSDTTVSVAPLPPEALIPTETFEKQKLPLISVTGDVPCSQKDFRINLFIPGDEDLILLVSGSAGSMLDHDLHPADSLYRPPPRDAAAPDVADDFLPLEENNMELDQNPEEHVDRHQELDQNPEEYVDRHQTPSEGRMIRERRQVQDDRVARTETPPPPVDVWALHDAYAVFGEDKPFKSGKCYKVPDGLDDGGKRKRKRPAALQDFRSWFRGIFNPPEQKLKNGPKFTDLNYIYLSTMKDKLKTRKRIYRRAGVLVSDEELRKTFLQLEEAGPQQQGEEPEDGFRHPDLLGGDDASDNEHEAFPDDLPAEFNGGADAISPGALRDELSYEDLVKLRVEQLVKNCRGYTQETALSRRVKDWEDMVRPELLLQEQRSVFDIHDYGDRIVGALGAVGQRRSFAAVVAGLDNFEACKYLLASLQLANDYTVEVDSVAGLEDSVDSMGLTLLSTHRASDRFKDLNT